MRIREAVKIVFAIICVLGLLPDPVWAEPGHDGWSTVGAMSAPAWDGRVLRFRGGQGTLAITPLSDDVIRVRFTTEKSFGRDHSYAVIDHDLGPVSAKVESSSNSTTLATASVKVTVQWSPLRISFANAAGDILDADDPDRGIAFAGPAFRVAKQLRDDEHVYGFGEKNGKLDKRGWKLGGYNYVMWNSDTFAYDPSTDPIYVSVPFYLVVRHGQAHGIFLDDTWRSTFDVGRERQDLLTFGAEGGDLDYYFINGPDPEKGHRALHRADRPDAVAAAVVARLQSMPLQLLSRNRRCAGSPTRSARRRFPPMSSGWTFIIRTISSRSPGITSVFRIRRR